MITSGCRSVGIKWSREHNRFPFQGTQRAGSLLPFSHGHYDNSLRGSCHLKNVGYIRVKSSSEASAYRGI
jgi:hypothetical protein